MNLQDVDCVRLPKIHKHLYLCSKNGSQRVTGKNIANITVASEATVDFLKYHKSEYRAFVIAKDTINMTYTQFKQIFEKASSLLDQALQRNYKVFLSCYAGINRSVTTIVMYVILYTKLPVRKTIEYIRNMNKQHRDLPALTNPVFEEFLFRYAKSKNRL